MSSSGAAAAASSSSSAPAEKEKPPYEVCKGNNGLDKIILRGVRGSSVEIYLYGAQVMSWKNGNQELLFVSKKAIFKPPKAIRGGIPLCFPHCARPGNVQSHGFARNRFWAIDPSPPPFPVPSANKNFVDLILKPTEEDMKIWPHRFEFRLRVTLGPSGDLIMTSRIRNLNPDGKPFSFNFAYHTYFSVSDISEVRVEGLETLHYLDNLKDKEKCTDQGDALTFESEVDKIYLDTPSKIVILDHDKKLAFVIRKDGLPDAVVWNPWDKTAKALPDFGNAEFNQMLCIEPAAIENPITLKPGYEWTGKQHLSHSTYCTGPLDPGKVLRAT
ncbi:galactose mutarotase-like superfamily protein [Striga asiatica]|uniref:glucose-6-phosphate 1-epimerase n=1 Tax=Striga asiatica TaxID=4170 RepID=A0A5A7R2W8_STRAF|nr:galactose mutarotase-like superfamily protein [Striga asiatica]